VSEPIPTPPKCALGGYGAWREVLDGKFLKRREDIDCTCPVCRWRDRPQAEATTPTPTPTPEPKP